jgi:ABC-type transport system involved in multi-copper enzyme maturation permease subunit
MNAPVRPLRFSTVVSVELRKMTDTRTSRGLLAGVGTLLLGVLAWKVSHPAIPTTFHNYAGGNAAVVGYAAPILGLLAMSSEWTQRTALTTFTLVPRRLTVLSAKLVTALLLSATLMVGGLVLAAGGVALGGGLHGGASFADLAVDIRGAMVVVLLHTLLGAAFGALAAQSTVALGAYFLAPVVWSNVAGQALHGAAPWLDIFRAYERLASAQPVHALPQTLTALSLWVLLPGALGLARSLRREVV